MPNIILPSDPAEDAAILAEAEAEVEKLPEEVKSEALVIKTSDDQKKEAEKEVQEKQEQEQDPASKDEKKEENKEALDKNRKKYSVEETLTYKLAKSKESAQKLKAELEAKLAREQQEKAELQKKLDELINATEEQDEDIAAKYGIDVETYKAFKADTIKEAKKEMIKLKNELLETVNAIRQKEISLVQENGFKAELQERILDSDLFSSSEKKWVKDNLDDLREKAFTPAFKDLPLDEIALIMMKKSGFKPDDIPEFEESKRSTTKVKKVDIEKLKPEDIDKMTDEEFEAIFPSKR
jgi:hypothetical protein